MTYGIEDDSLEVKQVFGRLKSFWRGKFSLVQHAIDQSELTELRGGILDDFPNVDDGLLSEISEAAAAATVCDLLVDEFEHPAGTVH